MTDLLSDPGRFFEQFLGQAVRISGARSAAILARPPGTDNHDLKSWRVAALSPKSNNPIGKIPKEDLAELVEGDRRPTTFDEASLVGVSGRLPQAAAGADAALALFFDTTEAGAIERAGSLLPLLTSIPHWLEQQKRLQRAETDLGHFASVLDLTVLLYSEERFQASLMLLCNELASRLGCHRVSLGWLEGNHIEVRAVSHTDKLEKRMDSIQQLAAVMEEAIDQGSEILYPSESDRYTVDRDHKVYAGEQKLTQILTLPLVRSVSTSINTTDADDAELRPTVGALTIEKDQGSFSDQEIRSLRLLCDQATPRLWQVHQSDGWFGARGLRWTRRKLARVVGVDHTWMKLLGLGLAIVFAVLIFGRMEFRVKAPFSVETDSMVFLSAPFAGYLGETDYREGDSVSAGIPVFELDTSELLLQKQQALAEATRHRTESVRAEAAGEVSEMRVAKAQLEQAQAQLALVEYQLDNAQVKAAFDGVIVEGELAERVNSPVDKGEVLVKLAKLEGLYPELKVDESDIRFVNSEAEGEVAFAARPGLTFPMTVERIEPAARSDQSGNHFTARCRFQDDPPEWWRPGMTGVAKIDCGERSLLWIFTRKTVDQIRLFFW